MGMEAVRLIAHTDCYSLNVCVSLKFIGWNPNLQGDGIGKYSLWCD